MTLETLAKSAGISNTYLLQIENFKRNGSAKTIGAIAKALSAPLDILTYNDYIKKQHEPLAKVFHSWFDKLTTNGISNGYKSKVRSP